MQAMIQKPPEKHTAPKKEILPKGSLIFTKVLLSTEELSEEFGGEWVGPIRDRKSMWYGYEKED